MHTAIIWYEEAHAQRLCGVWSQEPLTRSARKASPRSRQRRRQAASTWQVSSVRLGGPSRHAQCCSEPEPAGGACHAGPTRRGRSTDQSTSQTNMAEAFQRLSQKVGFCKVTVWPVSQMSPVRGERHSCRALHQQVRRVHRLHAAVRVDQIRIVWSQMRRVCVRFGRTVDHLCVRMPRRESCSCSPFCTARIRSYELARSKYDTLTPTALPNAKTARQRRPSRRCFTSHGIGCPSGQQHTTHTHVPRTACTAHAQHMHDVLPDRRAAGGMRPARARRTGAPAAAAHAAAAHVPPPGTPRGHTRAATS